MTTNATVANQKHVIHVRWARIMKCNFLLLTLCVFSIVSRISPMPRCIPFHSQLDDDSLPNFRFSPTLFDTGIHDLVSSNWNRCWRPRLLRSANRSSFLTSCLLLLSGDVEANPGPRYPCGHCAKSVRSNQPGIFCEACYSWYHTNCI